MTPMLRNLALACLLVAAPAGGSVHDIHLHTDSSPDWTSLDDFVATATGVWEEPEDQAIALWRWMVRSHFQASHTREDGRPLWDPILFYGSYPNSFCGYMAAFLTTFVDAMGGDWRHRYVELGDHTVAEVSWDAGATWHMFDTSMVVFARRHDGGIASCADIAAADECALSQAWGAAGPEPGHLYLYHADPACMTNPPDPDHPGDLAYPSGYRKASDNPVLFSRTLRNGADSYTSGFDVQTAYTHVRSGHVNRLHLRPGQTYTRSWSPLGSGSEYARLDTGGEDPNDAYYPANIRSNGIWEIRPDFSTPDVADALHDLAGAVHRDEDGGDGLLLRPAPGATDAAVTLKIDAANVLTSARVRLAGERGAGDRVVLEVSRDAGITWTSVYEPAAGAFSGWHDLDSDLVGGAFEVLVRARLEPDGTRLDCGLNLLHVDAVTQLNRMTLPRLQRGANRVRFAAGPPVETMALRPGLHAGASRHWTDAAVAHGGLVSRDDPSGYSTAIVVPAAAGDDGWAVWRLDTPTDIVDAAIGGSFITRFVGAGDFVRLSYSWDGEDFVTAGVFDHATAPTWDGRLRASPTSVPAGRRSVWLRCEARSSVDAAWNATGIQDLLLQVRHEARDPAFAPVAVTWCWTEHRAGGDVTRQHTRIVTAPEETWDINVGGDRDPTMAWVRLRLDDGAVAAGYDDGEDVGPGAGYDKTVIEGRWLDDVALGRPYDVSRPSAAGVNPDDGGELTDGTVIPPVSWSTASLVQGQVAYWEGDSPLAITVDLADGATVAAVRVHTHQPNADYGHAGTIAVAALDGAGQATPLGVIQHDDVWSPPGDHLDWGFVRSGNYAGLPAGGRLAHGFWLVPETPATADALRLDVLPLAGRGVGISEIQIFSDVVVRDWPDREADVAGGHVVAVATSPGDAPATHPRLRTAPNPANPGTVVLYDVPGAGRVRVRVLDLRGRVVRTLRDGWQTAGAHRARWDGRGDDGRALPSGRYLAVVEQGGRRAAGDVTLVR